jgi:hypothetical protein
MDTFVVRIYGSDPSRAGLRGVVDEIASGDRETFRDADELLAILSRPQHRRYDEPEREGLNRCG